MDKELRILIVEDFAADAELIARELVKESLAHTSKSVKSKDEFLKALQEYGPDIILCDYKLPGFGAPEALEILKKSYPETPLIVVSGTIGEDIAVDTMKFGAVDYIMKDRLARLVPAIRRAIEEARIATERKRAEETIARTAREWQTTFDAANDGIWLLDKEQRVLRSNKMADQIFQRPCGWAVGQHCWEIAHCAATGPIPECPIQRVRKSLCRETMELQIGQCWYQVTGDPILDAAGQYAGAVHTVSDITERKKAQQVIEEARACAENIVETIREPLIVLDADLRVLSASRSFYQTFKVNPEETKGQFIYDLGNRQWDIPKLRHLLEEILPRSNTFDDYEIEHNFETIGPKIMLFNARRLATMQMILITIEDITEHKKAQEEIKEAAKTKSASTSKVSHELRTPLTAMKEGIALVLDGLAGDINEEQKELLGIAKKNVDRLTRLINDILDFQKLDSGRVKFNLEANDVNQIVNDVYKMMVLPAKNVNLDFLLELDQNLPKVKFDSDKITQVLTNLVNNAIKFTEKGNITIKTFKTEDAIQVSVSDTGCGISQEDLPKLFSSFEQLHSGGDRKTGGTGLGLAISKEIIELHGGRIWVESEPGRGSKFMFTLPVCCTEGLLKKYINDGIGEASKNNTKMSLILISIADFDKLKQELSGEKVDSILHDMEALLENNLRRAERSLSQAADAVLKLSDENFVVVTNCSKENILRVKGKLEQILDDYLACQNVADKIKLLFGFATYPDDADTEEDLIMKAKELQAAALAAQSV